MAAARRSGPAARLTVTFHKVAEGRVDSWWEAVRPTGGRTRGGWMPIGRHPIPHDMIHLAAEGHLGIEDGVWGLLARGATYKRGTDRRPTRPGRALVRDHRDALHAAEHAGNTHGHAWLHGQPTPVAPTFERLAAAWAAVPPGGTLTITWPTLAIVDGAPTGRVSSAGGTR
jgi:hypothetical protein